jgi:hypothetical protein
VGIRFVNGFGKERIVNGKILLTLGGGKERKTTSDKGKVSRSHLWDI